MLELKLNFPARLSDSRKQLVGTVFIEEIITCKRASKHLSGDSTLHSPAIISHNDLSFKHNLEFDPLAISFIF